MSKSIVINNTDWFMKQEMQNLSQLIKSFYRKNLGNISSIKKKNFG